MLAVDTVPPAYPDVPFDFLTAYVVALCCRVGSVRGVSRVCVAGIGPGPTPQRSVFDTLPQLWFIALLVVWLGSAFVDYRPNYTLPRSASGK